MNSKQTADVNQVLESDIEMGPLQNEGGGGDIELKDMVLGDSGTIDPIHMVDMGTMPSIEGAKCTLVSDSERDQFAGLPYFQRPLRCATCKYLIIRAPEETRNYIICPNPDCGQHMCWICEDWGIDCIQNCSGPENTPHHSEFNLILGCPGWEDKDVRNESGMSICMAKFMLCLMLPFLAPWIYTKYAVHRHWNRTRKCINEGKGCIGHFCCCMCMLNCGCAGLSAGLAAGICGGLMQCGKGYRICKARFSCWKELCLRAGWPCFPFCKCVIIDGKHVCGACVRCYASFWCFPAEPAYKRVLKPLELGYLPYDEEVVKRVQAIKGTPVPAGDTYTMK